MNTLQSIRLVLALGLFQACGLASAQAVRVCADPNPPPWTYWVRDANNKNTKEFIGSSVDTVRAAFERIGRKVEFNGEYPWIRCLAMVERGDMDFAMDAYFDTERAKRFAYSVHYNTLTPQIFFRTSNRIAITKLEDLKKHRGCGMLGASYAHYGLAPKDLDLGSSYEKMITKLKRSRCDYFVEELEVIAGYKMLGTDYLKDPEIQHGPVPSATPPAKHLITARNGEATKLLPALDAALTALAKSGETERAWKKHTGNGLPFKP